MDLTSVTGFRVARTRADLALAPGEALLGGGTWLFSQPQPAVTALVDLTGLGWEPWERLADGGLRLGATCTVEQLLAAPWPGQGELVRRCVEAFLMSFKVQHSATLGGNLALALPAGALISLTAGLGGSVVVWTPDGRERREAVADFVRGVGRTSLAPGEVIRAVEVPAASLSARTAFRRTSLATHGRSAAVVVGRADGDAAVLSVTAATTRPVTLRDADVSDVDCWYDDPHGAPDWREAVSRLLCEQVLAELHG